MNKPSHNYQLDFYKLFFALSIFYLHTVVTFLPESSYLRQISSSWGTLSVHFFFVISGYLMVNSLSKKDYLSESSCKAKESLIFVIKKFKGIATVYFVNFAINLIIHYLHIFTTARDSKSLISKIVNISIEAIPELFVIEMIGIRPIGINNAAWYVSAMLIAMLPLVYLYICKKDFFLYIFAPFLSTFLLTYFYKINSIFIDQNKYIIPFTGGLIRAFCGLSFGAVCWIIADYLKTKDISCRLLGIIEVIIFALFLCFWFSKVKDIKILYPMVLLVTMMIAIAISEKSTINRLFKNNLLYYFNSLSIYIYFTHTAATKVIRFFLPYKTYSTCKIFVLMIIITFVFCCITYFFEKHKKIKSEQPISI